MPRVTRLILAVLVSGCPSVALAQNALTLEQVVEQTIAHNRSLQVARATVRESDARVVQARAGLFPRVSFVESWQRGDQPVFVFGSLLSSRRFAAPNFAVDALNSPDSIGFFHGALTIDQLLFDGGRTRASRRSASLQRDIAILSADEAASGLAVAATEAYGRLHAAGAAARAAGGALAAAQEDLARSERRRDAGTITDPDVLAMTVHLADVRQRLIQAAGDARIARAELNHLMGAPVDRALDAQEPIILPASRDTRPLSALFADAEASRPDLRRAAAAEQLADEGRRLARAAWYPQIAAQAGYELNGTRLTDRASAWIIGGELRWSLSTGGAELAQRNAAAEAAARVRTEREDARSAVQVEIVTALGRVESARARQAVGQATVEQARESQRIIRDRFDAGLASVNDVLRASSTVLDADAQRVAALVDAFVHNAALERALGRKR